MSLAASPEEKDALDVLTSDYDECREQIESADNQFWRRTLVRTMFSIIEATNSLLKNKALQAACSGDKASFNATRIELLQDSKYRILKNGKLEQEPRRDPFINYTAFILRTLAEESYTEAAFFAENGWNEFQKAVVVRDRLTHAKQNTDVNVSDAELQSVDEALRWYYNATITAMGNKKFWTLDMEHHRLKPSGGPRKS